ncbi:hypothetical protein [Nitrospirillum iridis]|uniref:Mrp family chromosome partitioning ATPase n=1 Tax=Nitrospirillum iridis TaxID=765888 RepID=A0A7X0B0R3_9PROT|nr:hypothetical protein [Nitrospirillum iridis]MBB6253669.1 Mrp family chromosome partitioning ATPase [Nitrospirillum iridis]
MMAFLTSKAWPMSWWSRKQEPVDMTVDRAAIAGQPLFSLFNKLAMMPHGPEGYAIQIIGARPGAGASTIARALAEFAAVNVDGPVLLVDADPFDREQVRLSEIPLPNSLHDAQQGLVSLDDALRPLGTADLMLAALTQPIARRADGNVTWSLSISAMGEIVGQLRQRFRWIIFDSAPPQNLAFAHVLSRFVNGTVIVVEAERTRLPVVQQLIHQIRANGGKPVGLVINKRRLLISEFIYRFL